MFLLVKSGCKNAFIKKKYVGLIMRIKKKCKIYIKITVRGKMKTWQICLLLENELMHTVSHSFPLLLVGMKSEKRLISSYV